MSDNQQAAGAAQDDAGQGAAGAGAANANDGQQSGSQASQQPSANQLIKQFADARGVTVASLLDRFTELENAGKSELERLTGERDSIKGKYDALASQFQTVNARAAVTEAAGRLNAIDSTAVFAIARDSLEFDGNGEPTNVEAVIKDVQKRHPALFRAANGSADGGKGGGPANTGNINDVFRELARTAT